MSESNGEVITLGRIGRVKVRLDESTPVVTLDVVHVYNQWIARDALFRDKDGKVPSEKTGEYNQEQWKFAAEALGLSGEQCAEFSYADALHFIKMVDDQVKAIKPFFEPASADEPSSPASTELTFSVEED